MTDDRFARRLPDLMHELVRSDERYLDDILARTARTRQRPAWSFPGRWLPAPAALEGLNAYRNRLVVALLLVAMLALLVGMGAFIGGQRRTEPPPLESGPPPSPTASLSPAPSPSPSASGAPVPSASMLPDRLPGARGGVAGEYRWTGVLGSRTAMHSVIMDPASPDGSRQTQLAFAVQDDCFPRAEGAEPTAVTVAGLDALYLEPYDDPSVLFLHRGRETTGAYSLLIGDRTLCAYVTWDPAATPDERSALHAVVESIRGQPFGESGIQIHFTLAAGWDTG